MTDVQGAIGLAQFVTSNFITVEITDIVAAIATVVGKLEAYRIERSNYPASDAGLSVLTAPAANPSNSYYVSTDKLLDPWGRQFVYVVPGPGGEPFEVISLGADGKQGGSGEDEDLTSAHLRDEVGR